MPIKRVMVRWGDEDSQIQTGNAKVGNYRNRKPFCGTNQPECYFDWNTTPGLQKRDTGMTCKNSAKGDEQCNSINDNWYCANNTASPNVPSSTWDEAKEGPRKSFGNSERACQQGFFQRRHTYNCGPSELSKYGQTVAKATSIPDDLSTSSRQLADPDGNGYYDGLRERLKQRGLTPIDQKQVCVYRPKVQVLDNWGWCNGSCGSHLKKGGNPQNQSDIISHPNGGCYAEGANDQCKERVNDAWATFKGKIIVIPRRQY